MEKDLIKTIRSFSEALSRYQSGKLDPVTYLEKLKSLKKEELSYYLTGSDSSSYILLADELSKLINIVIIPEFSSREHFDFDEKDFRDSSKKTEFVLVFFQTLMENGTGENSLKNLFVKLLPELLLLLSSNMDACLWCSSAVANLSSKILQQLKKMYSPSESDGSLNNDNWNSLLFMSINGSMPASVDTSSESTTSSSLITPIFTPTSSIDTPTSPMEMPTSSLNTPTYPLYTPTSSIFGRYLNIVKPRLSKNSWMKNPNIQKSFEWMLKSVTFPRLSDFVDQILPPCLNFLDDYNVENKCRGIRCVGHVIKNCTREELRWYGRSDVIYDALHHQLYNHDPCVIEILHPVFIDLLPIFGQLPNDIDRHHQVFGVILRDVEFENKILTRRALTQNLPQFVKLLGISTVMHSKKLLDIFQTYLDIYDGPEETSRLNILKVIQEFILNAWPRVPCYTLTLSKMLLKFIYDISGDQSKTPPCVKARLIIEAKICFIYLKMCDSDKIDDVLLSVESIEMNDVVKKIIKDIKKCNSCENVSSRTAVEIDELCDLLNSSKI